MSIQATQAFELELLEAWEFVIGIDEVGRGALAGPVMVAAAVVSRSSSPAPEGLRDSKLLSPARREALAPKCASWAQAWAIGEASAPEIDHLGIMACLRLAAERALEQLWQQGIPAERSAAILDGTHNYLSGSSVAPAKVITRAKADRDCCVVAAASVIAKVERDRKMVLAHERAPHFAWSANKGYGSAAHRDAIAQFGPHELHRVSWLHEPDAVTE